MLLKIAMTYLLGHVWAGITPLEHVRARTPLAVNQTLSRHYAIWQPTVTIYNYDSCRVWLKIYVLLLKIATIHPFSAIYISSVTKNSDD